MYVLGKGLDSGDIVAVGAVEVRARPLDISLGRKRKVSFKS